jgi:hypothetical protein
MQNAGVMRSLFDAAGGTRTEAKSQALSWLASQLRWERTLDALREDSVHAAAKAA